MDKIDKINKIDKIDEIDKTDKTNKIYYRDFKIIILNYYIKIKYRRILCNIANKIELIKIRQNVIIDK